MIKVGINLIFVGDINMRVGKDIKPLGRYLITAKTRNSECAQYLACPPVHYTFDKLLSSRKLIYRINEELFSHLQARPKIIPSSVIDNGGQASGSQE
eukprot:g42996.t1